VRVAIVGTFLILAIGAMYYAQSFFLPLVLAVLITLAFAPLVRSLAHRGIPAALSAVMLIVMLGGGLATASAFLSDPVRRWSARLRLSSRKRANASGFCTTFARLNDAGKAVQAIAEGTQFVHVPSSIFSSVSCTGQRP
jgi:hypothetical protein